MYTYQFSIAFFNIKPFFNIKKVSYPHTFDNIVLRNS